MATVLTPVSHGTASRTVVWSIPFPVPSLWEPGRRRELQGVNRKRPLVFSVGPDRVSSLSVDTTRPRGTSRPNILPVTKGTSHPCRTWDPLDTPQQDPGRSSTERRETRVDSQVRSLGRGTQTGDSRVDPRTCRDVGHRPVPRSTTLTSR